jgi:hypothetical protein
MIAIQDLLERLFQQPMLIQLGVFAVWGLLTMATGYGFLLFCRRRQLKPAEWIPVAPFSTSLTTMFALFLAFHASAIWANKARAERAHTAANMAIKRLDDALGPGQLNLVAFREELHRYVGYVIKDEWRRARNHVASPRANAAFSRLNAMALATTDQVPATAATHLMHLLDDIAHSRSDKLWLGANHTETASWLIVFALGVVAHFGIAAVHFDRPKAGLVALALFASASTIAYTSLGMIDDPYRYLDSLLDPSSRAKLD